ncbi:MAG: class I SAM-dependent methyltransferase [Thermoproteota archaeon]
MVEWEQKREIMQRYDLTSHLYDVRYAQEQTDKMEVAIKDAPLRGEDRILDVGCGTGLLFKYVAKRTKSVVALDISLETLLKAQERAKKFENVHLILADADHLPVKSGSFNHLYFMTVLQNVPDPPKTLLEARRVVKEEGSMVITGLKKKFTIEKFEELLRSAGLTFRKLKDEGLNCQVAVCKLNKDM